jgi:hypothetical protein
MNKKCSVCGKVGNSNNIKGKILFGDDFCIKHLWQMKKYKKITDKTQRTIYDRNPIIIHKNKDYNEIILLNSKGKRITTTKINKKDLVRLSKYKWCFSGTIGYVCGNVNGKMSLIHRIIMNNPNCKVDHKNRDKLDNRRNNLRLVNNSQNRYNSSKSKKHNFSSKYIGVSFCSDRNEWLSQICINKKVINLGRYSTEDEAVKIRLKAEKRYFGEYSPQLNLLNKKQNSA